MNKVKIKVGSYEVYCKNDPAIIQAVIADLERMDEEDRLRAKHLRRRNGRLV